ncbi:hypothetical protein J6590_084187 [Homalodisca vitripennis]|nr:hypothetical protein J6590_084187 [Homalodisca vitripennis]
MGQLRRRSFTVEHNNQPLHHTLVKQTIDTPARLSLLSSHRGNKSACFSAAAHYYRGRGYCTQRKVGRLDVLRLESADSGAILAVGQAEVIQHDYSLQIKTKRKNVNVTQRLCQQTGRDLHFPWALSQSSHLAPAPTSAMSLLDNLLRKIAEFLVVLQMFLMASCWPTPLDEYEEEQDQEQEDVVEDSQDQSSSDVRRRPQLGMVNG